MDAEERWHRIAIALFIAACCLLAMVIYGVYSGDDFRGILMTAMPAAICALAGLAARRQRDLIAMALPPTALDWVIRGAALLLFAGIAAIILTRPAPHRPVVDPRDPIPIPSDVHLETVELPRPDGTTLPSLVRVHERADCPDRYIELPAANDPTRLVGVCP